MKEKKCAKINFTQGCILVVLLYFVIIGVFYFAAKEQLYSRTSKAQIEAVAGDYATPEVTNEFTIGQEFLCEMDRIEKVSVTICTFARANKGELQMRLYDTTTQQEIYTQVYKLEEIADWQNLECVLPVKYDGVRDHVLLLELSSPNAVGGNAIAPFHASTANVENQQLYYNGQEVEGTLCFWTFGEDNVWTGPIYWKVMVPVGILLAAYCALLIYKKKNNKKSIVIFVIDTLDRYKFLIKQLMSRDFKTKYKRSVLGALWSFVNPLLTMSVQYVVFSTIFKMEISNYPVYLLSGIVLFNFFTEATSMSLYSIVGNAGLITKVYVPKYIYPVSRTLSTAVNLLIALLPLFIMCLATGVKITKAWLILPFPLLCLIVFCIGVSFIFSAAMVFFRDVQFIWNVLSMALTYATPVFYPETILPLEFAFTLKFNPMYQYIKFFRTIVIQGISPEPRQYLTCAIFSLLFLAIGFVVFRKTQDKFIFHI